MHTIYHNMLAHPMIIRNASQKDRETLPNRLPHLIQLSTIGPYFFLYALIAEQPTVNYSGT